jgi:hypothetical protein
MVASHYRIRLYTKVANADTDCLTLSHDHEIRELV